MLIVSRRDAESILIRPGDDADMSMTLADLFRDGPIEITIFSSSDSRVKMGVQAPQQLAIWRKNAVAAA
jgi:sRNA-binding carbon storage regulator CsrA